MAGLLAQIGRGLRMGGGVMNADIFAQQEQERMQQAQRAEQRKEALAQFIFQAAQGGMLPAEEAHKALQAVNPELAAQLPTGAFGPSVQTQQSQMKFQQEQQDRAARQAYADSLKDPRAQAAARAGQDAAAAKFEMGTGAQYAPSETEKLLAARDQAQASGNAAYVKAIDERLRKLTYIAPQQQSQGDSAFGSGLTGRAYETVARVEQLRRAGKQIPEELGVRYTIAQHILQNPQLRSGPGGELMTVTPGLPAFAGQEPTAPKVDTVRPPSSKESPQAALSAISDVAGILNEAQAEGDTVTGVVGTAKRLGGGLARQAGVPVSPRAERLSRSLERLKAIVGPSILQDTRLSDSERKRIEQIVGGVDPQTDDVALRESLADLTRILSKIGPNGTAQTPQKRVVVDY